MVPRYRQMLISYSSLFLIIPPQDEIIACLATRKHFHWYCYALPPFSSFFPLTFWFLSVGARKVSYATQKSSELHLQFISSSLPFILFPQPRNRCPEVFPLLALSLIVSRPFTSVFFLLFFLWEGGYSFDLCQARSSGHPGGV